MTVAEFIAIWRKSDLTERSGSQQHFLGLCELIEHPKPIEADPKGESFTFERGAEKNTGGDGFADVWKKGFFGWEYKGKHKNLDAAYQQLLRYAQALENPPLMVVCDMDRIIIRTNFTNTPTVKHEIALAELARPENLALLRTVFFEPEKLKPGVTLESITTEAASQLGEIALSMRKRGLPALDVAHFLDRMIFCLFAEDVSLLPKGLFSRVLKNSEGDAARFRKVVAQLFEAMAEGGNFGADKIMHFNGNLFTDATVLDTEPEEIEKIARVSTLDWSAVDPSIFGTLFERGLDPDKRSQLGAHYTSRADIEVLVEPVVMQPLRREWDEIRRITDNLLKYGRKTPPAGVAPPPSAENESDSSSPQPGAVVPHTTKNPSSKSSTHRPLSPAVKAKAKRQATLLIGNFLHPRLTSIKVLDPACGSGNFLYVTLQKLKDFEKEVILYASNEGLGGFLPVIGPWQLYGIEVNPYAYELAQMTVWIGYLQWVRNNGLGNVSEPVLRKMDNFKCMDAIIDLTDPEHPKEPEWPKVDFIVGNPPFLGDKLMRSQMGDEYVTKLRTFYVDRIPGQSDLCCYWFERARAQIASGHCKRAGLLATQNIRGGASRKVLDRVKDSGNIFFAVSDRRWILDGANVHISMIAFDQGAEPLRVLDGQTVAVINANLTACVDTTGAQKLPETASVAFIGSCKGGPFDIDQSEAVRLLTLGGNPHERPNSDVVRPVVNSQELLGRIEQRWIVDFADLDRTQAALYESPHRLVVDRVKPVRDKNRDKWLRENWWRPQRMRPEMRKAIAPLPRFLVTPTTSKHRIFAWLSTPALPDHKLVVLARADDYSFGVMHSRIHEAWARAVGTQLRERESGLNYNVQTSFETFPLPRPTPEQEAAIAEAAKELDTLRNNWLNPPEWTKEDVLQFPGSVDGPWARYVHDPDSRGIGTVRYPRLVPKDEASAKLLSKRTLTNLYNHRPDWLDLAHRRLDEAVFATYGWPPDLTDEQILEKLLALNLQRAGQ
jgi:type II restriction/modification system DNA methylase subunit YeeA